LSAESGDLNTRMEFVQKPHLSLYIGKAITDVIRMPESWQWAIVLEGGIEIRNKDRRETFKPRDIIGHKIRTISLSEQDTTLHFSNGQKWSLNPTQYAIYDPAYGGEAYPQWPGELEDAGIPSHPEEDVSTPPSADWERQRQALVKEGEERITEQAREWVEEDQREQRDA
jgi:hypothetical protein